MSKLIFLVGISGSGKTTWSTDFIADNKQTIRTNRDDIRKTLVAKLTTGYYKRKDIFRIEEMVSVIEDSILHEAQKNKYSVIVDNTNLKKEHIAHYLYEYETEEFYFKFFDIDVQEAKLRVTHRDGLSTTETQYLDKQAEQYKHIKQWILDTYPDHIIT